jgi:hypothetical protein
MKAKKLHDITYQKILIFVVIFMFASGSVVSPSAAAQCTKRLIVKKL